VAAPASVLAVVGTPATVSAPASLELTGRRWLFASWSDGGAPEHAVTVPAADALLTARFDREPAPAPVQPTQPQQPVNPQAPAERRPVELRIPKRGLTLSRAGVTSLVVSNPGATGWGGDLMLSTATKIRASGTKARLIRFARKTVVLKPGAKTTVKLSLKRADRQLVARLRRVRVTLVLDGAGTSPSSQAQTVLTAR
jgi:hypothetical protein